MKEPVVSVGIMSQSEICFVLHGNYVLHGQSVGGEQKVAFAEGKIRWNKQPYSELLFEAKDADAAFTLKNVTIGVNFHWERREDQRFEGALKFIVENETVTAINILPVENYLTSVIASEMSSSASIELLKAHAVISRSWLLCKNKEQDLSRQSGRTKNKDVENTEHRTQSEDRLIKWYESDAHTNFDVCADDHCQRYQGVSRAFGNIERVKQAIAETRGEALVFDGRICDARFSKCCGGVLEEFESCWADTHHPYLTAVRDAVDSRAFPDLTVEKEAVKWIRQRPNAFCDSTDAEILSQALNNYDRETRDFYRWSLTYSAAELSELVKRRSGVDFGTITDLIPIRRGVSGRLTELKIIGTQRTMIIGKELEIRRILSESHLYSSAFYVEKSADKFLLHGAGWGHGVGLCQIGAAVMGEKGYLYDEILKHY
ncbi:MAG: SpoIID/LytB domain-containing protein, partial [Prevotellaceae bacterium]|nr:SpoIID/LytB domain-containing protein [Prevotellaceae bacterium]